MDIANCGTQPAGCQPKHSDAITRKSGRTGYCFALLRSFRVRLFTLILLILIPGLGIAIYGNFEQRQIEKNRVCEGALAISKLAASNQEDFMDHARQILATLTELRWLFLSTNDVFIRANLANLCKLLPTYATFGLIETNGKVFCSATITNGTVNLGDRSYFQRVMRTKAFAVGDFQIGRLTGLPSIDFGYPVLDDQGSLRRVLFTSLVVTNFYEAIKGIRVPAKGTITVLDRSGNVVARCPDGEKMIGKSLAESPAVKQIRAGKTGIFELKDTDGIERLYATTPAFQSQEPCLFVMVEIPLSDLVAPANRVLVRNIAVLAGFAILMYLGAAWCARYFFVNPVRALAGAADRLAAGDLTARVGILRGPAELDHLGRALDDMAGAVQERTDELFYANQSLRKEMAERERAEQEAQRQAEEKKKLEEQFLRSQRMESLGALAGGIAHDLNNALVPVLIGSELLRETANGNGEQLELLDMITASSQRCTAMVKQILTFARGNRSGGGAVPVRHLVNEMAKIAKDTFPKNINIECSMPNDLWAVAGEATELHQILMNLCVNARDAMPDGGTLSLIATNQSLSREVRFLPIAVPASLFSLRWRTQEPAYPRKFSNGSSSRFSRPKGQTKAPVLACPQYAAWSSAIMGSSSNLKARSAKARDSKIHLRAISLSDQKARNRGRGRHPAAGGNGKTILLVDDEQTVLELTKTLLENYQVRRVLTATNGLEAITCFEKNRDGCQPDDYRPGHAFLWMA